MKACPHLRLVVVMVFVALTGCTDDRDAGAAGTPTEPPPSSAGVSPPLGPGPTVVTGPTVRVSEAGSDNGGDGSDALPFGTIQKAVDVARPGTTVLVAAGTYAGFRVTRDGVMVSAEPGAQVSVRRGGADTIEFAGVRGGGIDGLDVSGSQAQYGSAVKIDRSSGVRVRRSRVHDARTFGIVVASSSDVTLEHNAVYRNAAGIEERYATDLAIRSNHIHDNLKEVDAGRGQEGINFYKSTGRITIESNTLWNNDTHFEVYGASNLEFRDNVTHGGQVMETGTEDGLPCARNRFVRNVSYRGGREASGMILRCARDMLVAHNVLDGFDRFAFDIIDGTLGEPYGGSVEGLRIVDNIVVRGRAYSIDNVLPTSVLINHNLVWNRGSTAQLGEYVAFVAGHGNTKSMREFVRWTGYDRQGVSADPRFVDHANHDYRLAERSPAIDRGSERLAEPFQGRAPDIGRYELR